MDLTTQCALEKELKSRFGENCKISRCRSVSGGSISRSFRLEIQGNLEIHDVFIKLNDVNQLPLFLAEESNLIAIAKTNTIKVPKVLFSGYTQHHSFIAMEFLDFIPLDKITASLLGEQLAQLHCHVDELFGFEQDNFIGLTPQPNKRNSDWLAFFRTQRLVYQLRQAEEKGLDKKLVKVIETVIEHLDTLFIDHNPRPSLLHGDLWEGNAAMTKAGEPTIFDPASYYGDRETDIAMTELFGHYPLEFYQSYNRINPLPEGYRIRRHVYNLYHLINHYTLFGGSYESQLMTVSQRIIAQL